MYDGDIDLKKDSNLNFQERRIQRSSKKDSKLVQKEFMCGRCNRGLGRAAVFYNKKVTIITNFVIGKTMVK